MKYWQYDSISKQENDSYSLYQQSFKANDQIRITIQNQDLYVLLHESLLNLQGDITLFKEVGAVESRSQGE